MHSWMERLNHPPMKTEMRGEKGTFISERLKGDVLSQEIVIHRSREPRI